MASSSIPTAGIMARRRFVLAAAALSAGRSPVAASSSPPDDIGCVDANENCQFWDSIGECGGNPGEIWHMAEGHVHECRAWLQAGVLTELPKYIYEYNIVLCVAFSILPALSNVPPHSVIWSRMMQATCSRTAS